MFIVFFCEYFVSIIPTDCLYCVVNEQFFSSNIIPPNSNIQKICDFEIKKLLQYVKRAPLNLEKLLFIKEPL